MNKTAFLHLINQVSPISDQEADELEKLVVNFPYCQTAHLLIAKAAYDKGSMLSNQKLRKAASYAVNRQLLKKLIHTTAASVTLQTVQSEITSEKEPETIVFQEEKPDVPDTPAQQPIENEPEVQEQIQEQEPVSVQEPEIIKDADAVSESELDELLTIANIAPAPAENPDPEAIQPEDLNSTQEEVLEETDSQIQDEDLTTEPAIQEDLTGDDTENENAAHPEKIEDETEADSEIIKNFDSFLFKPEKDSDSDKEEETTLKVNYPAAELNYIFTDNDLGYWMNSSRLGESLQLKDADTTDVPYHFHPELILEYSKTNKFEKSVVPEVNSVVKEQINIIDQFLKQNSKLKTMANVKIKNEPQEDLSLKSTKIKKSFASENLATIFVQQGKIKKAIKIYEHLILKIPEKKAYFVEQIEKLQKLS